MVYNAHEFTVHGCLSSAGCLLSDIPSKSLVLMSTTTVPQVILNGPGLATGGHLDITIAIRATIEVDAATAQRKATGWLVSEVGNLLLGDTPSLVITDRAVWRVPVLLTSPEIGVVGQVGTVDVDAQTGDVLANAELIEDLIKRGRHLARSAPPPTE
jgi:hypothetical protein